MLLNALKVWILIGAASAFAGEMLPLQSGNYWTYREVNGSQSFTVRVGAPLAAQGNIYYRLTGYVDRALWVRTNDNGSLIFLNEDAGREEVLTSFESAPRAWATAPFRPCESETQLDTRGPYSGPVGRFADATTLKYRIFSCGDLGVLEEKYLPSVGMVRRTTTTLLGPKVFELTEARAGNLLLAGSQAAAFDVSANVIPGPDARIGVTLRLSLTGPEPQLLQYADLQEYDAVLWNDRGEPVYRFSDRKAWGQASFSRTVAGMLTHSFEIPLRSTTASPLPDGLYALQAWLTAGPGGRAYSAITMVRVNTAAPER